MLYSAQEPAPFTWNGTTTVNIDRDNWDDVIEYGEKRKQENDAIKDNATVTKTYVKEAIAEALDKFGVEAGTITPEQVDLKISNAIKNISAD